MLNVLQIKQTEIHIKIFFFNDYCQRILVNGNKTSTDTNRNFIELWSKTASDMISGAIYIVCFMIFHLLNKTQ